MFTADGTLPCLAKILFSVPPVTGLGEREGRLPTKIPLAEQLSACPGRVMEVICP